MCYQCLSNHSEKQHLQVRVYMQIFMYVYLIFLYNNNNNLVASRVSHAVFSHSPILYIHIYIWYFIKFLPIPHETNIVHVQPVREKERECPKRSPRRRSFTHRRAERIFFGALIKIVPNAITQAARAAVNIYIIIIIRFYTEKNIMNIIYIILSYTYMDIKNGYHFK